MKSRLIGQFVLPLAAFGMSIITPACAEKTVDEPEPAANAALNTVLAGLEEEGFQGVVAIDRDGAPLFVRGLGGPFAGMDDLETLQVDSGSITKTFTAAALLKLVDAGEVSVDQTIADYFPEAPADKAGITVHQMLTHSAGLPPAVGDDNEAATRDDLLRLAFSSDLLFEPGSAYEYSNVGYSIIAAIIEKVSGKSYEDFLIDEILAPAGVTSTGFRRVYNPSHAMRGPDRKTIEEISWGALPEISWHLIGNGGVVTTASDMLRFRKAFAAGEIVSQESVAAAQTPHVKEGGYPSYYGYGMVVEDDPTLGRLYWHNGGNQTFFAQWTDLSDHGVRIFVATNKENRAGFEASTRIGAALID